MYTSWSMYMYMVDLHAQTMLTFTVFSLVFPPFFRYGTKVGVWWWETHFNSGGFDLATAGVVTYYCVFLDVLFPYLSDEHVAMIEEQMHPRMDKFMEIFFNGGWPVTSMTHPTRIFPC